MVKRESFFHMLFSAEKPTQSYEDFMPDCLDHVEDMMENLDRDYTDEMLGQVLVNQCISEKEFEHQSSSLETHFETHEDCTSFAKDLEEARDWDLATGSEKKYEEFCESFFVHKGGVVVKEEDEEEAKARKAREGKAKSGAGGERFSSWAFSAVLLVSLMIGTSR